MIAKIGIITTSDRASAGIYEDLSGKAIIDTLNSYLKSPEFLNFFIIESRIPNSWYLQRL